MCWFRFDPHTRKNKQGYVWFAVHHLINKTSLKLSLTGFVSYKYI